MKVIHYKHGRTEELIIEERFFFFFSKWKEYRRRHGKVFRFKKNRMIDVGMFEAATIHKMFNYLKPD